MNNPFGTQGASIVLTAASDGDVVKKEKKVDLVKIYLSSVPSLQSAKDDLASMLDSVDQPETKAEIEEFINSIVSITEQILDFTKIAIKGVRPEASQAVAQKGEAPKITQEMISGKPSVVAPK